MAFYINKTTGEDIIVSLSDNNDEGEADITLDDGNDDYIVGTFRKEIGKKYLVLDRELLKQFGVTVKFESL